MSDNKKYTGQQDRMRVDLNDAGEVEYLHQQYPQYTHSEIKEAIKNYGPLRSDIQQHLDVAKNQNN